MVRLAATLIVAAFFVGLAWAEPQDEESSRRGYGGMMGRSWSYENGNRQYDNTMNDDRYHGMMDGYGPDGWSGGMMGPGYGMMGPGYGMMGPGYGMMGPGYGATNGAAVPGAGRIDSDDVNRALDDFIVRNRLSSLEVGEIMEFDLNYYAQLTETGTGKGALEVLIGPYTGYVTDEPGPNMMWNTKYGHMGGWNAHRSDVAKVSGQEAIDLAQRYLDRFDSGLKADDHADEFPGYFTLHVLRGDEIVGMLSVNAFDGRVWYHSWHGEYRGGSEEVHR